MMHDCSKRDPCSQLQHARRITVSEEDETKAAAIFFETSGANSRSDDCSYRALHGFTSIITTVTGLYVANPFLTRPFRPKSKSIRPGQINNRRIWGEMTAIRLQLSMLFNDFSYFRNQGVLSVPFTYT